MQTIFFLNPKIRRTLGSRRSQTFRLKSSQKPENPKPGIELIMNSKRRNLKDRGIKEQICHIKQQLPEVE
jgi:hypothetical protein